MAGLTLGEVCKKILADNVWKFNTKKDYESKLRGVAMKIYGSNWATQKYSDYEKRKTEIAAAIKEKYSIGSRANVERMLSAVAISVALWERESNSAPVVKQENGGTSKVLTIGQVFDDITQGKGGYAFKEPGKPEPLSESTRKNYIKRCKRMAVKFYGDPAYLQANILTMLQDKARVDDFIENPNGDPVIPITEKKGYYSDLYKIIVRSKLIEDYGIPQSLAEYYHKKQIEWNAKYDFQRDTQKDTKSSKVIYEGKPLEWETVLEKAKPFIETRIKGKLPSQVGAIVCALYTAIPARRAEDYYLMKVYTDKKSFDESDAPNKMHVKDSSVDMIIRKFKTSGAHGEYKRTLDKDYGAELARVVIESCKKFPREDLLVDLKRNPYKSESYSKVVARVFNEVVFGKREHAQGIPNIGINVIRRLTITWFLRTHPRASLNDKNDFAYEMGHTRNTQSGYQDLLDELIQEEFGDERPDTPPRQEASRKGKEKIDEVKIERGESSGLSTIEQYSYSIDRYEEYKRKAKEAKEEFKKWERKMKEEEAILEALEEEVAADLRRQGQS